MKIGLEHLIDDELLAHVEESRAYHAAVGPKAGPSSREGLAAARAGLSPRPAPPGPPAVETIAEADGRRVPVRIITPESGTPRGVYLDIHGGGFYMGWAARGDAANRRLADALGVTVVSVDYRLAPEHPWPAAPDDCETAALWLVEEAESTFGSSRLAIGGASAGATLAMATLLRLRDRGAIAPVAGAALQFGTYDLSARSPAGRKIAAEYFIQAYAGHVADRTDPDISPLFGSLEDLPPALLVVGSHDILLEDNLAMAARLSAAGTDVDVRVYPECPHGFTSAPTPMAHAALRDIESWLADRLSTTETPAKMDLRGAGATGLEPATSGVTGRRSNQLSYAPGTAAPSIGTATS